MMTKKRLNPCRIWEQNYGNHLLNHSAGNLAWTSFQKATFLEKNDLIIFYIEELDRTILIDREFKNIEPLNYEVDDFHYPIWYNDQDVTDDSGIAQVRAHILFSELFEVIQDYCNIYHIPFMELCKDRHFILETINLQPTHDFEEISAGYKAFEKLSADQPQDMPSPEIGRPFLLRIIFMRFMRS